MIIQRLAELLSVASCARARFGPSPRLTCTAGHDDAVFDGSPIPDIGKRGIGNHLLPGRGPKRGPDLGLPKMRQEQPASQAILQRLRSRGYEHRRSDRRAPACRNSAQPRRESHRGAPAATGADHPRAGRARLEEVETCEAALRSAGAAPSQRAYRPGRRYSTSRWWMTVGLRLTSRSGRGTGSSITRNDSAKYSRAFCRASVEVSADT